jgi:hypothetical protein
MGILVVSWARRRPLVARASRPCWIVKVAPIDSNWNAGMRLVGGTYWNAGMRLVGGTYWNAGMRLVGGTD